MDQTVEKTIDRLGELLDRATKTAQDLTKTAQDLEVRDRLTDAVSALRRTRITQDEETGVERFVTGLLIGVAVGFGLALLLAPKSGEELRDDLMQRGIELRDRAGELASRMPFGDGDQGRTEKASSEQPGIA
ncbi:MAG TPA: YtxH domain-containing protein [Candidatus Dormibacteraeota bacterium]|nr:YtxH domain-containing protein [Candidatus Dormibacteraeota bacterium]